MTRINLVGVLFVLWGAICALIGASLLALGFGAAALIDSASGSGSGRLAGTLVAATLITLALMAIVWGAAHIFVGLSTDRRRHWSRIAALVLGFVDLLIPPYGTALGGFTLWVLLRDDARRAFEPSAAN